MALQKLPVPDADARRARQDTDGDRARTWARGSGCKRTPNTTAAGAQEAPRLHGTRGPDLPGSDTGGSTTVRSLHTTAARPWRRWATTPPGDRELRTTAGHFTGWAAPGSLRRQGLSGSVR